MIVSEVKEKDSFPGWNRSLVPQAVKLVSVRLLNFDIIEARSKLG